ncbi:DUF4269 domain-containing protein [Neptunitalea lumnitzerae]|uniref:Alpha/beta hydrolase n=1 Tax=Neptunitalea lumnitzerae TaxID=2965509 RepID=A0ABQ5MH84_9FLAO|nr:DUF4269 domain-containing protein [Neptunitalea sp. Y10]GLB48753.1 alpha/beta hydrolase [Neptunitalea sp. Y10]
MEYFILKYIDTFIVMDVDFTNISYLEKGNQQQQNLYRLLTTHNVLSVLAPYQPLVVGTIPIGIDVEGSDADIILQFDCIEELPMLLHQQFSEYANYRLRMQADNVLVCNFSIEEVPFELYATNIPTQAQYAFKHMLKEYEILQKKGATFKAEVLALKKSGMKTEPAFCKLLGLEGNPYEVLLKYNLE